MQRQARIKRTGGCSGQYPEPGEQAPLPEQQAPDTPRLKAQRKQEPGFRRALLEAEHKEHRHQKQRRDH